MTKNQSPFQMLSMHKQCEREEEMNPNDVEIISGYNDREDCNFYLNQRRLKNDSLHPTNKILPGIPPMV